MATERPRVLVIDDEPEMRCLLGEMVETLGYETDLAASGEEGLKMFERQRYEAVLTDYRMPGLSGWDVALALRARDRRVGVIVLTALRCFIDATQAQRLGVSLLEKPADLAVLAERLAAATASSAG